MSNEHFDVLIIGAGLSGIGAGVHLQDKCPDRSYAILEARDCTGGTWDLFRYPGIRSDSDMCTMGYSFKPWTLAKSIADGTSILKYVRDTAAEHGIDRKIRFGHRLRHASWSTEQARWTVQVDRGAWPEVVLTCNFLFVCCGYYRYDQGYTPEFAGIERFNGRIVHPQKWTADIDHAGKRVVVIGSGATAVTLVPALARDAAQVTMLQRSPTYMVARPDQDAIGNWLRKHLPGRLAYALTRWKNVLLGMYFYKLSRSKPERVKAFMISGVTAALGPDYDVGTHFTPRYNPWDQRVCLVPNGDLFESIKTGRATVVTDQIEAFVENGVLLRSGKVLEADLIVTATGLSLQVLGGMTVDIDGHAVDVARTITYKGMMYRDVPNLAVVTGYTNASWTLKCDLTCEYVCRLLNHMKRHGFRQCTPRNSDPTLGEEPWVNFSSGYIQRSIDKFPKQGSRAPWKLHQNYALDLVSLKFGAIDDGVMAFDRAALATAAVA